MESKMKKLIYALALIIPLSAQEAKDDPFHASVGKEEVEQLRKIYFDCDDYAETTWTVLLYHNFTYVTLVRD